MSFRIASKEALKSKFGQHRVGAVIVKNGRVLSTGYNERRYTKELGHETVHAEEMAVLKLLRKGAFSSLVGSRIYVSRFTRGGHTGLARPCLRCQSLLRSVGVLDAYYSDSASSSGYMKL